MKPSAYDKINDIWTNIILAGLLSSFLYIQITDYTLNHKFSSLLGIIQIGAMVLFFLLRVHPQRTSYTPKDWIVAITGSYLPLFLMPSGTSHEIIFFLLLQFIGMIISISGIISLNTSFGIVPALRVIKTGGLYRFIRHPIYCGYFISMSCLVIQNISIRNIIILAGIISMDILRIKAEEKFLSTTPEYQLYQSRTRWRLIPFLW